MYLLYTDESNVNPERTEFFVYGGVAVNANQGEALCEGVAALRAKYGYRPGDVLKFNTHQRPASITPEVHRAIKQEVMELAGNHSVKLFVSVVLHDLANNPEKARRYGINTICFHFNCFLRRETDVGLVLIDTFNEGELREIIREKCAVGLRNMPYSKTMGLTRILGYHIAMIGGSHLCALTDIVLGALSFAINKRNDEAKAPIVTAIMNQLAPLFLKDSNDRVSELSLFFSPKIIAAPPFQARYERLHAFFGDHGMTPAQRITNVRIY